MFSLLTAAQRTILDDIRQGKVPTGSMGDLQAVAAWCIDSGQHIAAQIALDSAREHTPSSSEES